MMLFVRYNLKRIVYKLLAFCCELMGTSSNVLPVLILPVFP